MMQLKTCGSLPLPLLSGTERYKTIESLWEEGIVGMTQEGERQLMSLVLPPWQRPSVWGVDRQKAFIEGIFLGFSPGAIVTVAPDWVSGASGEAVPTARSNWLIDGQQRVTAIREFVEGRLSIFDGVKYLGLERVEQIRRFDGVVMVRMEMRNDTAESVLKELYRRMNYGGIAHTAEDLARVEEIAE